MTTSATEYWNQRYQKEGMIWGATPSRTAEHALRYFQAAGVHSLQVPGSGYGRNTRLFSTAGLQVTGREISPIAVEFAARYDPLTRVYPGAAFESDVEGVPFDALYCFNVLHLLRVAERSVFIQRAAAQVVDNGLLYFVVFSELEESFGKGQETEPYTFESKPGRPVHYFTAEDLSAHFARFHQLESGIIDDPEDHGGAPHIHRLRYIIVRKAQ